MDINQNELQVLADTLANSIEQKIIANQTEIMSALMNAEVIIGKSAPVSAVYSRIETKRNHGLSNLDISTKYRNIEIWCLPNEFYAALAYCVVSQNTNVAVIDLVPVLAAFRKHILEYFEDPKIPEVFTYEKLQGCINSRVFESIPEIAALNEIEPEFICLGALAQNMFFMILREHITQDS